MATLPRTASPYDDLGSPAEMRADCLALRRAAERVGRPAPSLHFDEQPAERAKPAIEVSDATTRIAQALGLYLE